MFFFWEHTHKNEENHVVSTFENIYLHEEISIFICLKDDWVYIYDYMLNVTKCVNLNIEHLINSFKTNKFLKP